VLLKETLEIQSFSRKPANGTGMEEFESISQSIRDIRLKYLEYLADASLKAKDDEDTSNTEFKPLVSLPLHCLYEEKMPVELDVEEIFSIESQLFIQDKQSATWIAQAKGPCKVLRNKKTGRCRILIRQMRTYKVALNCWVDASLGTQPHSSSNRSVVVTCPNINIHDDGGELESQAFCIRFPLEKDAQHFLHTITEIKCSP